jgi:hypothetical protein
METEAGTRFLIVEQKGRDIWCGGLKSIHEAIENGAAALGVERALLSAARDKHSVTVVMITVEEQRRIFLTPIDDFFNDEMARSRTNFKGWSVRMVPYQRFTQKYLGPNLQKRKRLASKSA